MENKKFFYNIGLFIFCFIAFYSSLATILYFFTPFIIPFAFFTLFLIFRFEKEIPFSFINFFRAPIFLYFFIKKQIVIDSKFYKEKNVFIKHYLDGTVRSFKNKKLHSSDNYAVIYPLTSNNACEIWFEGEKQFFIDSKKEIEKSYNLFTLKQKVKNFE